MQPEGLGSAGGKGSASSSPALLQAAFYMNPGVCSCRCGLAGCANITRLVSAELEAARQAGLVENI